MKPKEIKLGMVFTFGICTGFEYVVISLDKDGAMLERITSRREGSNRHKSGYEHFEHSQTKHIRMMDEKEFLYYQSRDPVCNLEKGIYKVNNNIYTLLEQPAVREDEIIRVTKVYWDNYKGYQGEHYKLIIIYQQFGEEQDGRFVFSGEEKNICIRWFRDNFQIINTNQ